MLADAFAPLTERDLFNLPRFRMAIRTGLDGETRIHHRCAARAAAPRLVRCRPAPQRRARRSRPARNARWLSLSWSETRSPTRSATTGTSVG